MLGSYLPMFSSVSWNHVIKTVWHFLFLLNSKCMCVFFKVASQEGKQITQISHKQLLEA